jgi:hypothetical protein
MDAAASDRGGFQGFQSLAGFANRILKNVLDAMVMFAEVFGWEAHLDAVAQHLTAAGAASGAPWARRYTDHPASSVSGSGP